ncbi:aspartate/glutamate racemase family protein [Streptomyces sp. NPDC050560]|uniref:aspartate/glutamate racemase family protein n=1 Tax=Streptomyces sp. NPDC050560 TaxID=3365630 RepID=UPI0037A57576
MRIWHQSFTVLEDVPGYAALLAEHAAAVVRPGTEVVLHGLRPGSYPAGYPGDHIRYSYLQRCHAQQFVEGALRAEAEGYDAVFLATIPDIALEDIRALLSIPVIGYGQASLLVAASLAPRVGIVSFIEELRPQLRRNAELYGLGRLLGPVVGIDASLGDVTAGYEDPQPLIGAVRAAAREAIADGARAVIPGEGPLNVFLAAQGLHDVDGVPLIDSVAAGLKFCELRVDLARSAGLKPARGGLYHDRPPAGLLDAVHAFYGR